MCFPPVRGSGEEKKKRLQPIRTKGAPFFIRPLSPSLGLEAESFQLSENPSVRLRADAAFSFRLIKKIGIGNLR
ncbi:MAG: hypothetical protein CW342_01365 [Thermoactinomycetaceae bacterium]|nr:hypothetical protein [Thermoactinomycetaceae bacterium]